MLKLELTKNYDGVTIYVDYNDLDTLTGMLTETKFNKVKKGLLNSVISDKIFVLV